MSTDKIERELALKIIQFNLELSEEEKAVLLQHGRIYRRRVKEILETTPMDENEKEVVQQSIRDVGSRGPNPPLNISKDLKTKLLNKLLDIDNRSVEDE